MKIYMELRGCSGGLEADMFAEELLVMYLKFAKKNNINCEIIDDNKTKIILFEGKEKDINPLLTENGVHRVQRVSKTSSKDKMHTSTASVAIMPVYPIKKFSIKEEELEISNFKASGAGGQHRNKTESAVRIKHLLTGIIVTCSNERSQHQNKEIAMEILYSKLHKITEENNKNKENNNRKNQIGSGAREESRRTYNYVRSEVTDDVTGKKCSLKEIMNKVELNLLK